MTQVSSILLSVSSGKFWQLSMFVVCVCKDQESFLQTPWYVCMVHVCMLHVYMCCIIVVVLVGSVCKVSVSYGQLLVQVSLDFFCQGVVVGHPPTMELTMTIMDSRVSQDEGHCIPACYCKHCHCCASQQWKNQAFALPLPCSQY